MGVERLTVESACTEPNQIAISSCMIRLGVQGLERGEVSMIHWMQSAWSKSQSAFFVCCDHPDII